MYKKFLRVSCLISMTATFSTLCFSDYCPTPDTSIVPSVYSNVSFDKKNGIYTYNYKLQSDQTSLLPIDTLEISITQPPIGSQNPLNWNSEYLGANPGGRLTFMWDTLKPAPSYNTSQKTGVLPTPAYAVKPGANQNGFVITSTSGPGLQQFFAKGFTQIPRSTATTTDD